VSDPEQHPPEAAEPPAEPEEGREASGPGAIVFLDPSAEARDQAEELEEELGGLPIWTFEPAEFGADTFEEIAEASAIVIEWNLQGQCGIDVLEALLFDERTREIPVLLASASPTRAMVMAALRCGARSFTMKPYQADELRRRLESAGVSVPTA
jgi:CheY-like chemotaxis protein